MRILVLLPTLLLAVPLPAFAQPAASPQNAESVPQAPLPDPAVDDSAPPSAFVTAARSAIAAGRTGEATEAIERAESRLLVRSVRPSRAATPSDQALVQVLGAARTALAQGDRALALGKLAEALANPALDAAVE